MKKRLLYIGEAYHQKTGSADFMLNMLHEQYDVTSCLVDLYSRAPFSILGEYAGTYDVLACWHVMPPMRLLRETISYKHGVVFPMADACPSLRKPEKWYPYRNCQFISFSRKLHEDLKGAGFSSHHFQYFPEPMESTNEGRENSAFFWYRRHEIGDEVLNHLLNSSGIRHLHTHNAPDPEMEPLADETLGDLERSSSQWFDDKEQLLSQMSESAIYIAPRIREGIGMSFLEAMAMGRCVIAPNRTTMNEYITHGVTGLLYEPRNPRPMGKHDIRRIQRSALDSIHKGYKAWQASTDTLLSIIEKEPSISRARIVLRMLIRAMKNPSKTIKSVFQ